MSETCRDRCWMRDHKSPPPAPPTGEDEKLKPCPFCGGEAASYICGPLNATYFSAGCTACNVWRCDTEESAAIKTWNARAPTGAALSPTPTSPRTTRTPPRSQP